MSEQLEKLMTDLTTRIEALGEQVNKENIRAHVKGALDEMFTADPEFVRKMRFAGQSEDRITGSKFARWNLGISDIEFLYDLMTSSQRRGGNGPSEELTNAFNALSKAFYIDNEEIKRIDRQAIDNIFPRVHRGNRVQYEAAMRAMDTAESGFGAQLVGAQYVGDLWEAARAEMRVAGLIGSFEMTAPVAYLPVEVDFPAMLHVAESTEPNSAAFASVKTGSNRVAVTAKKFVIHQMWSGEMEEDSIIAFVPFLRMQAQKSIAFHLDSLALNGDSTTTNGINGLDSILSAGHHTGAFDGIRHGGLVDNAGNSDNAANAPIALAHFRNVYGRMIDGAYLHDWGHPNDPNDVVHVVDPYTADQLLTMDEFLTRDKAGNDATLFAGQVARVFNHPIVSSIALKKSTVNGFVDDDTPGNNLYGQIVTFNRNGLKWGWRRRVQVETERIPSTDQNRIVYSLRLGLGRFTPTGAAGGIEWADVVYNLNI